jgi:putative transcriptional regulator
MDDPIAPGLLISMPQLIDPNFKKTVVLMIEHGDHGAMGLVLNRSLPVSLRDLCVEHSISYRGPADAKVFRGGPVEPWRGFIIHRDEIYPGDDTQPVGGGFSVTASMEALQHLCGAAQHGYRVLFGYAGWGPGQLERELNQSSWLIHPLVPELLIDCPPDELWDRVLEDMGVDPMMLVMSSGDAV